MLDKLLREASRISNLPGLGILSPARSAIPSSEDLAGYLATQRLAQTGAKEVAGFITEGWTERKAGQLLNTWLHDHGINAFFHYSYAWFGERTRFAGINRRRYHEFMPSERVIRPGEPFILDTAPIFKGYMADIGYSGCLGENLEWTKAMAFLNHLRSELVHLFQSASSGGQVWNKVNYLIQEAGYANIHELYPFSVLGHRVYQGIDRDHGFRFANFGWQSYWSLLSRGVFGQLLNQQFEGDLVGLWAIEPHIGGNNFGAKFEEILVVESRDKVYWLEKNREGI